MNVPEALAVLRNFIEGDGPYGEPLFDTNEQADRVTEAVDRLAQAGERYRELLAAADAEISHMRHRGSFVSGDYEIDRLIGNLRNEAKALISQ